MWLLYSFKSLFTAMSQSNWSGVTQVCCFESFVLYRAKEERKGRSVRRGLVVYIVLEKQCNWRLFFLQVKLGKVALVAGCVFRFICCTKQCNDKLFICTQVLTHNFFMLPKNLSFKENRLVGSSPSVLYFSMYGGTLFLFYIDFNIFLAMQAWPI